MDSNTDLSALRIDRTPEPPSRRGRTLALGIGIATAIAVGGFLALRFSRAGAIVAVSAGTVEVTGGGSSGGGISANGYVVARTKASVSSKILGRLAWTNVTEGSRVRKGETIARLESADYEAAVTAAQATLAQLEAQNVQAQRDVRRAQSLRAQNLVADA